MVGIKYIFAILYKLLLLDFLKLAILDLKIENFNKRLTKS